MFWSHESRILYLKFDFLESKNELVLQKQGSFRVEKWNLFTATISDIFFLLYFQIG